MQNNQDHLDLLLRLLSKNKNAPSKSATEEELTRYIFDNLTPSQAETLRSLMNDPNAAENFLQNPQVRELLKKLKNK